MPTSDQDMMATMTESFGSPSYESLRKMYHLRSMSTLTGVGFGLAAVGFLGVALPFVPQIVGSRGTVSVWIESAFQGTLAPCTWILVTGIVMLVLDVTKRRLVSPYAWEVGNDFVRFMCQEGLFPKGLSRRQFKYRVRHEGRGKFTILFSLDIPGCDRAAIERSSARIADSFGCGDKYEFWENEGRASSYSRGYRYGLTIVLLPSEKAYERAGRYHD